MEPKKCEEEIQTKLIIPDESHEIKDYKALLNTLSPVTC